MFRLSVFWPKAIDSGLALANMLYHVIRFAAPLVLVLSLTGYAAPARAALSVCNKTSHAASVALGFFNGKDWASAGWWQINANACSQILKDPLNARYYYLYAVHHEVGGAWDGDRTFCVRSMKFAIPGRKDCQAQGYEVRHFFQVDTGNSLDWTENLAD